MADEKKLPCSTCKYNGFKGLVWHCRHPEILKPIRGPLMARIALNGDKCEGFVDEEKKIMPGWPQTWVEPVSFSE